MKVLTQEEMVAKLDFRQPLHPPAEENHGAWPIPFEYGSNGEGTRISIAKAKYIAAELRAEVAEAEKRELFQAFKQEQERSAHFSRTGAELGERITELQAEINELKRRLRRKKAKP